MLGTLAAAWEATPESRTGTGCGVAAVLAKLDDDEDRAWLQQAAADKTYTASRLSKALASAGIKLSDQQIRRHRNGCSCGPAS